MENELQKIEELAVELQQLGVKDVENHYKEYNGDRTIRRTQSGKRFKKTDDGDVKEINKAVVSFPQDIVKSAVAYLLGTPPTLNPNETNEASEEVANVWRKNRMDAKLMKFAETVKSECISALVFYFNAKDEIKCRVLGYEDGQLYPYFDEYGDLVAFGWEYINQKDKEMRIFTNETTYILENKDGWKLKETEPNLFGKIPVVFLQQKEVEWKPAEWEIDRYEKVLSVQADINDEFGEPKYKIKGEVTKDVANPRTIQLDFVETESGKVIEGDVEIISAPNAVQAIEAELDRLEKIIHDKTNTVKLTMESAKGIGHISNTGMELMFQEAIKKAKFSESDYEVVIDRCLNVIKAGLADKMPKLKSQLDNLSYDIQFNSILPKSDDEKIKLLMELYASGAISMKTMIELNPLVIDKEAEIERLEQENALRQETLGETYKIIE